MLGKPSNDVEVNHPDWIPTQQLSQKLSVVKGKVAGPSAYNRYCRVVNRGNKKQVPLHSTAVSLFLVLKFTIQINDKFIYINLSDKCVE